MKQSELRHHEAGGQGQGLPPRVGTCVDHGHHVSNRRPGLYGALSATVGAVSGVAPHVLHHVGPLAGAALVSGAQGSILFGVLGFVLTVPFLLQLKRKFGTWAAPGVALVLFAAMFTASTLWVGPALRDQLTGSDEGETSAPEDDPHHGH